MGGRPLDDGSVTALQAFLDEAPGSALRLQTRRLVGDDGQPPAPGRYERIAVEVADRAALRALEPVPGLRTAALAVRLAEATSALSLVPRPEWAALRLIRSREVDGGWLTVLRFAAPVPVHAVLRELARQSVWPDRVGERGLVVGAPLSSGTPLSEKVPPDVVLAGWVMGWDEDEPPPHPTTGRRPVVVTDPDGPLALGRLDERVLNPVGFDPVATAPVRGLPPGDAVTERLVRELRPAAGVLVGEAPGLALEHARQLAGLAMAGVPLTLAAGARLDPGVAHLLGPAVSAAVQAPVDLGDPLAREEHSVVLRRAALAEFASYAWRKRLGDLAGVRVHWQSSVSVVLATVRPQMLEHALAQVARQRGVEDLELVLAPHGFEVDAARVRELLGPSVSVVLAPAAADVLFGDVLDAAARAAGGDVVLKVDDDDWYGPDVVADLLAARAYSGAELVGMPDDFYHLTARDLTVRQGSPSEVYRGFVAGGTMLLERGLLREVGGFRSVRRHVDAQLIAAVRAAGGAVFRTHGLGYVLTRGDGAHTSAHDLDALVARSVATWPGFRPSRLLEL